MKISLIAAVHRKSLILRWYKAIYFILDLQTQLNTWCNTNYPGTYPMYSASQTSSSYLWRCYHVANDRYYYMTGHLYYSKHSSLLGVIESNQECKWTIRPWPNDQTLLIQRSYCTWTVALASNWFFTEELTRSNWQNIMNRSKNTVISYRNVFRWMATSQSMFDISNWFLHE